MRKGESTTHLKIKISKVCTPFFVPQGLHTFGKNLQRLYLYVIPGREGGDIGLFITLVPKVFLIVFFVGLATLGTFIEFWLVGSFSWVSKRCNI